MKQNIQPIKTAFILGAGLGTRLRPLTDACPKPLLRVGGRPIITYAMNHLISVGVERFIVNTHHCAEAYHLAFPNNEWQGIPIIFRHEPTLLDTAGGLKNIEDILEQDTALFVYNGDIISDIPLNFLIETHKARKKEVTLALRSCGAPLNVNINDLGDVCDLRHTLGNCGSRSCLFTGIYILEKTFLTRLKKGCVRSIVPLFVDMIRKEPGSIAGVLLDEGKWHDIGSINEYNKVNLAFSQKDASLVIRHHRAERGRDGMLLFLKNSLHIESSATIRTTDMTGGGSDRSFLRVSFGNNRTVVLMHYSTTRKENTFYIPIAGFLRDIGVTVPEVMSSDSARGFIILEDLGNTDLWSYRNHPWKIRREHYQKTLDLVYRLHAFPVVHASLNRLTLMEGFGSELYKWEQDYFLKYFVSSIAKIRLSPADRKALDRELNALSDRLGKLKTCLIHRDFQSRNVMLRSGEPVIIDFQGMRFGNYFYDLGSLLYDPYVSLTENERIALLRYYFDLSSRDEQPWTGEAIFQGAQFTNQPGKGRHPLSDDWNAFQKMFREASAQRLMQALGAYGFLGVKCGLKEFLQHIPNGVSNLINTVEHAKTLPLLEKLAKQCQCAVKQSKESL
jgi:NDP-sugar pyrophosphorylase family protein/tRNA A-37 threonylcarbamoyl transferase component Bud32